VKVFITDSAIRDLIAISDYIRPHNPDRAATFVDELLDHCGALAEFPQRYPLVPCYEHHGIRRCVLAHRVTLRIGFTSHPKDERWPLSPTGKSFFADERNIGSADSPRNQTDRRFA
jgi:plasmid stabilization system protein ParE